MSTDWNDPELEALLAETAATPEAREALIEEHRLLENDLLRLADPLPPPDFLQGVMRRVAAEPVRPVSRRDVSEAAVVIVATVGLATAALLATSDGTTPGLAVTGLFLNARSLLIALGSALSALRTTAALPATVALSLSAWASLALFRRAASPAAVKALP